MQYTKSEQSFGDTSRKARTHKGLLSALKSAVDWKAMCFVFVILFLLLNMKVEAASRGTFTLNTSAYSSTVSQTDSTPFITATGTRVRPGVLAVSRNLLGRGDLPYGTRVRAVSQRGCGVNVVGRVFVVEDTMNRRYRWNADIWMSSQRQALKFGRCVVTFQKL